MSRRSRLAVAFHVLFDFSDEHVTIGLVHVGCLDVQRVLEIHQVLHELIMTQLKRSYKSKYWLEKQSINAVKAQSKSQK